ALGDARQPRCVGRRGGEDGPPRARGGGEGGERPLAVGHHQHGAPHEGRQGEARQAAGGGEGGGRQPAGAGDEAHGGGESRVVGGEGRGRGGDAARRPGRAGGQL